MTGQLIPTGVTFGVGRNSINDAFSGTSYMNNLELDSGGNFSAGTGGGVMYSGGTNLYNIFSTGSNINLWISGTGVNSISQIGGGNVSSGSSSVAEGISTVAGGNYSHAEGNNTKAVGAQSHSEGLQTIASGANSHAEGFLTTAYGLNSHAEGQNTITIGSFSHAQGQNTTSFGLRSHAGGQDCIASGDTSFIHSKDSIVTGDRSVVLGGQNITGTTDDTVYVPYLNINNDIYLPTPTIPSNSGDTGSAGQISWDSDYVYICVSTNTWKRSPLAGW